MSYEFAQTGRFWGQGSEAGSFLSFDDVEARLLEAWGFLRRLPDREAGWLRSAGVSSLYREGTMTLKDVQREYGVEAAAAVQREAAEAPPALPGLRSVEVDRMEEALGWIELVEARDRKLIGVVLAHLDRGETRPAWRDAARSIGWGGHPDTLAKRYSRGITRIAAKVNRGGMNAGMAEICT